MEEPVRFDRGGTLGWSCTPGRSTQRRQSRNMNVVGGCAADHINKPPRCIILWPSGLDCCPEQRDWKSFESGVQSRTYMKWKLPTAWPLNTNQAEMSDWLKDRHWEATCSCLGKIEHIQNSSFSCLNVQRHTTALTLPGLNIWKLLTVENIF